MTSGYHIEEHRSGFFIWNNVNQSGHIVVKTGLRGDLDLVFLGMNPGFHPSVAMWIRTNYIPSMRFIFPT